MVSQDPGSVVVLTLTYGDRTEFLSAMADSVFAEGVNRVIVFCNGVKPESAERLSALSKHYLDRGLILELIESADNIGSAGYAVLISSVIKQEGVSAIWLMDDDNVASRGALKALLETAETHPGSALCAVREDRNYLIEAARTGYAPAPPTGVAFSVDFLAWPRRVMRRLSAPPGRVPDSPVSIRHVPYGGLFVPVSLAKLVDPPLQAFVLYADDYEYTERLSESGGLYLVDAARITDIETSWNATRNDTPKLSQLARLAIMKPDFRLYYALRNAIYLDRKRAAGRPSASILFVVNISLLYLQAMVRACSRRRLENAKAIHRAIFDGVSGRLGVNSDFPLP